ncbi:MAG: flagellar hook-basal body complex protein [Candidatus Gastranaerophilales bacterium]|nr:flagellar hook-basal body complex protein [Candidatus Gastranaerophilales bacterium]
MKVYGGVYYNEDGLSTSVRAMNTQTKLFGMINENIIGYNKTGYQNKEAVVSSFAEILGANAISSLQDHTPGRLTRTDKALDLALSNDGFFQYLSPEGVKLTRDGRFQIDKNGNLTTLEGEKVLSSSGEPLKFKKIPESPEDIKLSSNGDFMVLNRETKELEKIATIGVVSEKGHAIRKPDIKQGYVEASNVSLQSEFMKILPIRRNFAANRQVFIIQNNMLSQVIQQLSRS